MKVLHVYSGNLFGGVEAILLSLSRHGGLCPGMESSFALCFGGRLRDTLLAQGSRVFDLGSVRFSRPWSLWRARRRFRSLLKNERFDVVVLHSAWTHAAFSGTARQAGSPLVFWLHDFATGRSWIERLAGLHAPDLVICNSRFTQSSAPRIFEGVPSVPFYCPVSPPVSPPGSAEGTAARAEVRRELGVPAETVVIVQSSRLERWKGHTLHLRALAGLREQPGWMSWILGGAQKPGEAAYLEELQTLARELGIAERVRFLGQRSDVPRVLAAAEIHFQPNEGPEPFGIAFVEALYAGLPVLTTALGGALEIVDPSCGVLVEPGDLATLTSTLRTWVGSAGIRRSLGSAGPARARFLCDPAGQMRELERVLGGARPEKEPA